MLIAFNKPFGVLSQFSRADARPTLADHVDVPSVYPAGRLDFDSEGLMLLTDDGPLQNAIAGRRFAKRYRAQVDGEVGDEALARLASGVTVGEGRARYATRALHARRIDAPAIADRDPPIRTRRAIPTSWIELAIDEGRNRQVRRMTAAVGHPTLRLVRVGIGPVDLDALGLAPGRWRAIDARAFD